MNEIIKAAFISSIFLNLLFIGLGTALATKRGGMTYIVNIVSGFFKGKSRIKPKTEDPYFLDKKSHFESLPNTAPGIIFLGDSLIDQCEWGEFFRDSRVKNRGIAGDRTDGILARIDNLLESKPQKIFIMIGINDLIQKIEESILLNNYKVILDEIKSKNPTTKVFVQSLLPINNQKAPKYNIKLDNKKVIEFNAALKELANEFSFHYIDLFSHFCDRTNELDTRYTTDGLHLNGQAYLMWKTIIEKYVVN
jgi:lysophospholipase L1-like esterase